MLIRGNWFQGLGGDGVHVSQWSRDIDIVRNRFEDVPVRDDVDPDEHSDAVQVIAPTQRVRVVGNVVTGGRGVLFEVPVNPPEPGSAHYGAVLASNVFLGRDFGLRLISTPGALVVNNTAWGTTTQARRWDRRARRARVARGARAGSCWPTTWPACWP